MKVIAHRGYSGRYLENTMEAFIAADLVHADAIELDVRLSADGEVIVHHDPTLARIFKWRGSVNKKSAQVLKNVTVVKKGRQYHIATFDYFLFWFAQTDLMVNIEFKTDSKYDIGLERRTIDLIDAYDVRDRVFFSSFDTNALKRAKRIAPDIPAGLLVKTASLETIEIAVKLNLEYFHPSYKSMTPELLSSAHKENLKVNVWTVNLEKNIREMMDMGVDGVITDYPPRALEIVQENGEQERGVDQ